MCDLNGPFKLCTCSDNIDKDKPHWILKREGIDTGIVSVIVGQMMPPTLIDMIQQRKMLRRLNSVNVFDFDYVAMENDRLTMVMNDEEFEFLFKKGKWNLEEFLGDHPEIIHKTVSKGYIEGPTSRLKALYKAYKRKLEQGEIGSGIDIVKCGWSSFRVSEKDLIRILEDSLAGKKN